MIWSILNLPFGATSGFVAVMLGFLLKQQGISDGVIASLVAINLLPHTWKFLWSPIADSTFTRKRWYVTANIASCATILALAFVPITTSNLGIIEVLVFVNSLAITFLGMSVEGLMAHATPAAERGRAGGWFQAGNVGGAGFGGGLGLYLAENVSSRVALIVIAAVLFSCTAALRLTPETPRQVGDSNEEPKALARIGEILRELWSMIATRRGVVAVALCFLPIGAAAAQGLFSGQIATDWRASAELVAATNGLWAGVAATFGCLAGGWMSDRFGRRRAYALSGLLLAVMAVSMALVPQSPVSYAIFTLAYQFGGGVAYGTFTGFVLDVIGTGAAATKYNALASLSNIPILYMTKILGWASTKFGPVKMLYVDAASEVVGITLLILVLLVVNIGEKRSLRVLDPKSKPLPVA